MTELLGPILEGDDIVTSLRSRSKTHIESTITASDPANLDHKLKLEEKDGWELLRKNQKSYRLKKEKPVDEQLEDELWCLVARMGFSELSNGRNFKIEVGAGVEPRQIDVFAKDEDCALFIECTQAAKPKKKDMSHLIEKICAINPSVRQSAITHYGKQAGLKMRWIIATRNIEWGDADLEKAKQAKIIVIRDRELDYFAKLVAHIKSAARYQFLSHIFSGEHIKGLQQTVFATRGKVGKREFYSFLAKPSELLKLAYISHKASSEIDNIDTYQRMLKPARLKAIAKYIDNNGQFPTNIVVNLKVPKPQDLKWETLETLGDVSIGKLSLPSKYSCAWVIDGQHRLYGYAYSERAKIPDDKTRFPVLAYLNLPAKEEAQMFVDINCEQVKVQKSLLIEIYSTLNWGSEDRDEQIGAVVARLALRLDAMPSSPIYQRIIDSSNQKHGLRVLTTTSFSDGLHENKFFGETSAAGDFTPGPFWAGYHPEATTILDETLKKSRDLVAGYLDFYRSGAKNHWDLGDTTGGFLATNLGLRSIFRVLRSFISHIEQDLGIEFHTMKAKQILDRIEPYTKPISLFFANAPPGEVAAFRAGSSLAMVNKNAMGMLYIVKEAIPEFEAPGLQNYIDSRDEEGTIEARELVTQIQMRIASFVINTLKENFGEKNSEWWNKGVPLAVRTDAAKERELHNGAGERESYLYLIAYRKIALHNWANVFDSPFSFYTTGNKEDKTKWVHHLNQIRNKTMHPERGVLSVDEVDLVREIDTWTQEKMTTPGS